MAYRMVVEITQIAAVNNRLRIVSRWKMEESSSCSQGSTPAVTTGKALARAAAEAMILEDILQRRPLRNLLCIMMLKS